MVDCFLKSISKTKPQVKRITSELSGDVLYCTWGNKSPKSRILLLGHSDTVFVKNWGNFSKQKNKCIGPGVLDMKGGLVVMSELVNLLFKRDELSDIGLLVSPDEETGSLTFRSFLRRLYKQYDFGLVFEPGPFAPDWQSHREVVVGRKGITKITAHYSGQGGHSATELDNRHSCAVIAAQKTLEITALTDLKNDILTNVGILRSGTTHNTISPQADLEIDLRVNTIKEQKQYTKKIEDILKKNLFSTIKVKTNRALMIPPLENKGRQAENILNRASELCKIHLSGVHRNGGSDGNQMSEHGAVVFDGLGPVGEHDHTDKEYIFTKALDQSLTVALSLLAVIREDVYEKK